MPILVRKDTVAARRAAAKIERELGQLSEDDKRKVVEVMERHNVATAEGLKEIWGL